MAGETQFTLSKDVETLADAGGCRALACMKRTARKLCGCGCGSFNALRDMAVDQPLLAVVVAAVAGFVISKIFRRR